LPADLCRRGDDHRRALVLGSVDWPRRVLAEPMKKGGTIRICALAGAGLLAACDGPQSALVGAGPEAARVLTLTWILFVGAAIIFLGVMGAAAAALFGPPA